MNVHEWGGSEAEDLGPRTISTKYYVYEWGGVGSAEPNPEAQPLAVADRRESPLDARGIPGTAEREGAAQENDSQETLILGHGRTPESPARSEGPVFRPRIS